MWKFWAKSCLCLWLWYLILVFATSIYFQMAEFHPHAHRHESVPTKDAQGVCFILNVSANAPCVGIAALTFLWEHSLAGKSRTESSSFLRPHKEQTTAFVVMFINWGVRGGVCVCVCGLEVGVRGRSGRFSLISPFLCHVYVIWSLKM